MILSFLEHIERDRGNSARSRNARLAAIKSFFRFLEYRVPACLDQSLRVRAIPIKKTDQTLVASLTRAEIQALIDAPDPRPFTRARDRAMLHPPSRRACGFPSWSDCSSINSNSEVRPLSTSSARGGESACATVEGGVIALKAWLAVRQQRQDGALFLNAAGFAMTRSGFEYILAKHVITAAQSFPSIAAKRVTLMC